jgi:curved DNA-binding protein CbpA
MVDYYQLLGVTPQAAASDIRAAYVRLAKERHPDKFSDPTEKERAQLFFQDLTTAFNTLSNETRRKEYDAERERPKPQTPEEIARDAFEKSGPAYEQGDYQGALTFLQTAVHHAPREAQYHIALGRLMGRFKETARKGIEVLEKASQAFPQNHMLWYELAVLYQGQGLKLRAQKAAESALRLAPRDSRISRLAAELGVNLSGDR